MEWCQSHSSWTKEQWDRVLWTDESRFTLDFHDGRIRVHRLQGERLAPCCIREHDRHGCGSVMVWAGIYCGGRTELIVVDGMMTGEKYLDTVLTPCVIPLVTSKRLIFQDDNARPHRASRVTEKVREAGIDTLPWPARSPDLSPIEHAWDELGRRVRGSYPHPPSSLNQLSLRLKEQWTHLPQETLETLCDSMPSRIQACLGARGGHTRY